jgi:hypothetical protein
MGRITVILMLWSLIGWGQCKDRYIEVSWEDSCQIVKMSPVMFTEFYQAKKNLDLIGKEIPGLEEKINSLKGLNKMIEGTYLAEVDSLRKINNLTMQNLDECMYTAKSISRQNLELALENDKLKRQKNRLKGGIGVGVLVAIITILLK